MLRRTSDNETHLKKVKLVRHSESVESIIRFKYRN